MSFALDVELEFCKWLGGVIDVSDHTWPCAVDTCFRWRRAARKKPTMRLSKNSSVNRSPVTPEAVRVLTAPIGPGGVAVNEALTAEAAEANLSAMKVMSPKKWLTRSASMSRAPGPPSKHAVPLVVSWRLRRRAMPLQVSHLGAERRRYSRLPSHRLWAKSPILGNRWGVLRACAVNLVLASIYAGSRLTQNLHIGPYRNKGGS